jgi:hypothetical protein
MQTVNRLHGILTSGGVFEYSWMRSTDTMFVSRSDVILTIQFSDDVTCRAYEMDRPTRPPLSVDFPRTAKMAAEATTSAPMNSSRKPSHLEEQM